MYIAGRGMYIAGLEMYISGFAMENDTRGILINILMSARTLFNIWLSARTLYARNPF